MQNPSLNSDCSGLTSGYSYCIDNPDLSVETSTSVSKTKLPSPTSTKVSPTQSALISTCMYSKFLQTQAFLCACMHSIGFPDSNSVVYCNHHTWRRHKNGANIPPFFFVSEKDVSCDWILSGSSHHLDLACLNTLLNPVVMVSID